MIKMKKSFPPRKTDYFLKSFVSLKNSGKNGTQFERKISGSKTKTVLLQDSAFERSLFESHAANLCTQKH